MFVHSLNQYDEQFARKCARPTGPENRQEWAELDCKLVVPGETPNDVVIINPAV